MISANRMAGPQNITTRNDICIEAFFNERYKKRLDTYVIACCYILGGKRY